MSLFFWTKCLSNAESNSFVDRNRYGEFAGLVNFWMINLCSKKREKKKRANRNAEAIERPAKCFWKRDSGGQNWWRFWNFKCVWGAEAIMKIYSCCSGILHFLFVFRHIDRLKRFSSFLPVRICACKRAAASVWTRRFERKSEATDRNLLKFHLINLSDDMTHRQQQNNNRQRQRQSRAWGIYCGFCGDRGSEDTEDMKNDRKKLLHMVRCAIFLSYESVRDSHEIVIKTTTSIESESIFLFVQHLTKWKDKLLLLLSCCQHWRWWNSSFWWMNRAITRWNSQSQRTSSILPHNEVSRAHATLIILCRYHIHSKRLNGAFATVLSGIGEVSAIILMSFSLFADGLKETFRLQANDERWMNGWHGKLMSVGSLGRRRIISTQ